MTRVDEFDSFYSSTFAQAVQVTYAVSGDRQVAFEATVDAYRRAWRDWSKIRDRHPLGYVRNEAWKLTALSRGTHPLRRKHEEDSDTQLLEALAELSVDDRRLIVLMTLGNTDLEEASREVGLPAEEGIESVTTALASLETALRQRIDMIERRMHALASATESLQVPDPATVRSAAKRGRRRNTVLLVAASVAIIFGSGFVATDGDALASGTKAPSRQKFGTEQDVQLDAKTIDTGNLLSAKQVSNLDPASSWAVDGTDQNVNNTTPYATCPTKRYANKNPRKVFVRTFASKGAATERVAQAIEVSRSDTIAATTYERLVQWYSDCEHPRVQLVAAYTVQRPFGDFQILRLRSHRSPQRTFTVGFSHSGTITSTLVHEVDGKKGPSVRTFARTLNDSVDKVCKDSGGVCTDRIQVRRTDPPPTSEAPEYLGIVDLPPISNIDKVWAAATVPAKPNPAATRCDKADFSSEDVRDASARIYVLYEAKTLPDKFGVAETVGRFSSTKKAKAFVKKATERLESCADDTLSAKIDQRKSFKDPAFSGDVWRVGLEVTKGSRTYYRTSLIRRGSKVAQVTFTPAGKYDITQTEFEAVATRAATRLKYAK
ncbi:hypothetical protein [Aeromicrobium sp.]|uniref:hypothetical protein n=1 Tax=Aeromicrobium sp. TaxID=1871063 RepID=UPI0030C1A22D